MVKPQWIRKVSEGHYQLPYPIDHQQTGEGRSIILKEWQPQSGVESIPLSTAPAKRWALSATKTRRYRRAVSDPGSVTVSSMPS